MFQQNSVNSRQIPMMATTIIQVKIDVVSLLLIFDLVINNQ